MNISLVFDIGKDKHEDGSNKANITAEIDSSYNELLEMHNTLVAANDIVVKFGVPFVPELITAVIAKLEEEIISKLNLIKPPIALIKNYKIYTQTELEALTVDSLFAVGRMYGVTTIMGTGEQKNVYIKAILDAQILIQKMMEKPKPFSKNKWEKS